MESMFRILPLRVNRSIPLSPSCVIPPLSQLLLLLLLPSSKLQRMYLVCHCVVCFAVCSVHAYAMLLLLFHFQRLQHRSLSNCVLLDSICSSLCFYFFPSCFVLGSADADSTVNGGIAIASSVVTVAAGLLTLSFLCTTIALLCSRSLLHGSLAFFCVSGICCACSVSVS